MVVEGLPDQFHIIREQIPHRRDEHWQAVIYLVEDPKQSIIELH